MFNPTKLLKVKSEWDHFVRRHPAFVAFLEKSFDRNVREGDAITITYAHRDGQTDAESVVLSREDAELIRFIAQIL